MSLLLALRWVLAVSWLVIWLLIFWCNNWCGFRKYILRRAGTSPIPIAGTLIGAGVAWLLPGPPILRLLMFWLALCGTDLLWMAFSIIEVLRCRLGRK